MLQLKNNNNNHRDAVSVKSQQYLASDYLSILISYLQNLPQCQHHLQSIFNEYDKEKEEKLNIHKFERLLSVLMIEACNNSGHDIPNNTELTVSYILNILIQINNTLNANLSSSTNIEFTQNFVINLLKHLLSLKTKESKISSTPKTKISSIPSNASLKLKKKYKKTSSNLDHAHHHIHHRPNEMTKDQTISSRINRRRTTNKLKRSQSDVMNDSFINKSTQRRNKSKSKSRSRSKSTDLKQSPISHNVILTSSPSNSLVMTENILFTKYQKQSPQQQNTNNSMTVNPINMASINTRMEKSKSKSNSKSCSPQRNKSHLLLHSQSHLNIINNNHSSLSSSSYHQHPQSIYNLLRTPNINTKANNVNGLQPPTTRPTDAILTIERIPSHGNGSPSDSISRTSCDSLPHNNQSHNNQSQKRSSSMKSNKSKSKEHKTVRSKSSKHSSIHSKSSPKRSKSRTNTNVNTITNTSTTNTIAMINSLSIGTNKSQKSLTSKSVTSIHDNKKGKNIKINIIKPTSSRRPTISRRRTENHLLSIPKKNEYKGNRDNINRDNIERKEDSIYNYRNLRNGSKKQKHFDVSNEHLMLDLISEITELKRENKEIKLMYTNKTHQLESQYEALQTEYSSMQRTLRLYENRMSQMEKIINDQNRSNHHHHNNQHRQTLARPHSATGYHHPIYPPATIKHTHLYHPLQPQPPPQPPTQPPPPVIDRYYSHSYSNLNQNHLSLSTHRQPLTLQNNVSVLSQSSGSSSSQSSRSRSSSSASSKRSRSKPPKSNPKLGGVAVTRHSDAVLILDDNNENVSDDEILREPFDNNPSTTSNKYRTLEKQLHRKILQQRTHELSTFSKSRKNASLLRRKKSTSNKKFEPIQLQNDIILDDDKDDLDDIEEALPINPTAISLPVVIDRSKPNPRYDDKSRSYSNNYPIHKMRKTDSHSHQSISILSGDHDRERDRDNNHILNGLSNLQNNRHGQIDTDTDTDSEEDTDDDEIIIVCDDDGNNDAIIVGINDRDEKEEKQIKSSAHAPPQHKNNILEALQNAVQKQTEKSMTRSQRDNTMTSNDITTTTSNSTSSGSNVSSLFDSDDSDNEISSDCFHLFKDDNIYTPSIDKDDEKSELKPKYSLKVPIIKIPKSEKDLLKKVKPAYKWHLEMIDDDGSITYQIEQRKKRREREKQQQQMKQLYSRQNSASSSTYNNRNYHGRHHYNNNDKGHHSTNNLHSRSEYHRKRSRNGDMPLSKKENRNYIRMLYFESKPLGFQINESPESIFVTNVYSDRGSAFEKGVEKGWKIVEVNKQESVKGMMNELRNNNGPFNITFDTIAGNPNYHYS